MIEAPVPLEVTVTAVVDRANLAPARLVHDGTSYPARPVGLPPGMADYIGPTEPSDWANGDTWTEVGS